MGMFKILHSGKSNFRFRLPLTKTLFTSQFSNPSHSLQFYFLIDFTSRKPKKLIIIKLQGQNRYDYNLSMESSGARKVTWRVFRPVNRRLPKKEPKSKPQNLPTSPPSKVVLVPTKESISKRQKTEKSTMATSRIKHSQEESRVIKSSVEVTPNPPIITQHSSTAKQTLYPNPNRVTQHTSTAKQTLYPNPNRISGIAKPTSRPNPLISGPKIIQTTKPANQNEAESGQKTQGNPWNCSNGCINCLIATIIVLGILCLVFGSFSIFALVILLYNGDFESNWNHLTSPADDAAALFYGDE